MTNNDIYIEARKRYPHRWAGDVENGNNLEVFCEGAEWAREQIIQEACEWLSKEIEFESGIKYSTLDFYNNIEDLIADLRKAMVGD